MMSVSAMMMSMMMKEYDDDHDDDHDDDVNDHDEYDADKNIYLRIIF